MILGAILKVGCSVMAWCEIIISVLAVMKAWGTYLTEREKNRQAKKRKGS
jgi:hypothetical protein